VRSSSCSVAVPLRASSRKSLGVSEQTLRNWRRQETGPALAPLFGDALRHVWLLQLLGEPGKQFCRVVARRSNSCSIRPSE